MLFRGNKLTEAKDNRAYFGLSPRPVAPGIWLAAPWSAPSLASLPLCSAHTLSLHMMLLYMNKAIIVNCQTDTWYQHMQLSVWVFSGEPCYSAQTKPFNFQSLYTERLWQVISQNKGCHQTRGTVRKRWLRGMRILQIESPCGYKLTHWMYLALRTATTEI